MKVFSEKDEMNWEKAHAWFLDRPATGVFEQVAVIDLKEGLSSDSGKLEELWRH